jgi:SAM-dependent methyltransferase/glycosyltransferase involved in cell wall biosynthesis
MISELLTIVIPTRNRPDFLELCLRSVFESQDVVPNVIVSDNSTYDLDAVQSLRKRYGFSYIRQSGKLSMTEHHNACLNMPRTPWAMLLHDDDELYPNALSKLQSFLHECNGAGLVIGGTQDIDAQGVARGGWIPESNGSVKGEDGVLLLGLDFRTAPPGCIWNVEAFREVGGFPDANGASADYTLVLRLTYAYGVKLLPAVIGRYRLGPQQATDYSTPERAEPILDLSIKMAQLTRTIGVSAGAADQLVDYMTWWIFRIIASSLLDTHPFFVSRLCRKCVFLTPPDGFWKNRVRREYPFLFWRPQWLAILLYKVRSLVPKPLRHRLRDGLGNVFEGMTALPRAPLGLLKKILPKPAKQVLNKWRLSIEGVTSRLRMMVNVQPLSYLWGFDRGKPISRYYLEQFLQEFSSDIRGRCLEFQNPGYVPLFGGAAVSKLDILHLDDTNPKATIVADLTKPNDIPGNAFDCIVCTHVLHVIPEVDKALSELHRILKPGGVLLVAVPHISMCDPTEHELWRFTPEGLAVVLAQAFGANNVTIRAYGNSLVAAGELRGLVAHEFGDAALNYCDPRFAIEVCARAYKAKDKA